MATRPWVPTDAGSKLLAWRAARSASSASMLADKSGNGNHCTQSVSANTPVLSSTGWIDGTSPAIVVTSGQFYTGPQVIPITMSSGISYLAAITDDGSNAYRTLIAHDASFRTAQIRIHGNNAMNLLKSGSGDLVLGTRQLKGGGHIAGFAAWSSYPGRSDASRALLDGYYDEATKVLIPEIGMRGLFSNNASEYFRGLWAEDCAWTDVSDALRQQFEGYLAWTNNLQTASGGVLPSTHPYYAAAPTYTDGGGGGGTSTVLRRRTVRVVN